LAIDKNPSAPKDFGVLVGKSGYQIFQEESPEVAAANNRLISKAIRFRRQNQKPTLHSRENLGRHVGAALAHFSFAKKLGATREEIRETCLLTLTLVGLKGVNTTLVAALKSLG